MGLYHTIGVLLTARSSSLSSNLLMQHKCLSFPWARRPALTLRLASTAQIAAANSSVVAEAFFGHNLDSFVQLLGSQRSMQMYLAHTYTSTRRVYIHRAGSNSYIRPLPSIGCCKFISPHFLSRIHHHPAYPPCPRPSTCRTISAS